MDYQFDDKKPKAANNELVLLRKAISELLREGIKVSSNSETNSKQIQLLAKVSDQLERLGIITKASKPVATDTSKLESKLEKLAQAVERDSGLTKTVMVHDLEKVGQAIFDLNVSLLKSKGGSDDPTDYVNVRLTDGKEFYNAVKRAIASVSESFAPFVANDTLTPVAVRLNADGSLPITGTFSPPANQNVTLTNSIPTGGNLIGAVVLASGVTVAPSTGIQSVFVTGGNVVTLSGSVTTQNPIQQNVSVSGALPGGANGLGSVTVTSGNITVTNFPTSQNVVVTNSLPQHNVTVSGNVTVVATSGTLNSHVDNWPTTQHTFVDNSLNVASVLSASGVQSVHIDNWPTVEAVRLDQPANVASVLSASGVQNVHVDNYPSVQSVFVQNPTTAVTVSNTVSTSGTVGGTLTAIIPNTVSISGTVGGTVNAIVTDFAATQTVTATSGTLNAHVDNFPTVQQVAYPSLIASGVQHTLVDNFPSGFSINGVQGTVSTSGTVGGVVTSVQANNPTYIETFTKGGTLTITSGVAVSSVLAASGVNNAHVDNWPSVQSVFVQNPTTSVAVTGVTGTVATSGTVGGTVQAVVQNFNPLQESFIKGGAVVIASGVTSTSGTLNAHVDNWPSVQHVFVENSGGTASAVTIASGTSNINIGNFPLVQSVKQVGDSGQSLVDDTNSALKVNVVAGGAGGGVADTQVRDRFNNWTDVGFQPSNIMMPVTVSGITTSGIQHALIDNFPSGISVNGVQGTVSVSGTVGGVVKAAGTTFDSLGNLNVNLGTTIASGIDSIGIANFPTVQTVAIQSMPGITVSATASGVANWVQPDWPNGFSVNQVQGTVAVSGTVGGVVQSVNVASSGVNNTHVDNFPSVQGVNVEVSVPIGVSSVLAASGVQNVHVDNWPSVQHSFIENSLTVASIPAVTATSGTLNSHVDNWPTTQHVFIENQPSITVSGVQHTLIDNFPTNQTVNIRNINTDADGTVNVDNTRVGNTAIDVNTGNASAGTQRVVLASNQPVVTVSGNAQQPQYQVNTTPIKNISGTVSAAGMNVVASGVTGMFIKVFAYSLITASTTAVTVEFCDTNAVQAWQVPMQAITGTNFGANLSIDTPSYLFRTASTGTGLSLNLSSAQSVTYSLAYFYDSGI